MPRPARRAALALLLPALVACSSGGDDGEGSGPGSTATAPVETLAPTTTEPPLTGEPLVVVEQGVATFPDPLDPTATLGGYAVILENPNPDVMATGVLVRTRVLDASGTELDTDSALLNGILPGARMAVGRTLLEPIDGPTTLDVAVEVGAWLPPASEDGRLEASDVRTEPEEAGGSVTRFTVTSSWPSPEEGVDVAAVYRAADGTILGGELTSLDVPPDSPTPGSIRLLSPIPDLATTEVFVGRGFAAQTVG